MLHSLLLQVCMPFRMSVLTKAALILMGSSAGAGYDSQRGKRVKLSLRAWWLLGKAGHFSSGPKGTPWPCHYCLKPTLLLIALESDSWGKSKEEISSSVADLEPYLPFICERHLSWESQPLFLSFPLGVSLCRPWMRLPPRPTVLECLKGMESPVSSSMKWGVTNMAAASPSSLLRHCQ